MKLTSAVALGVLWGFIQPFYVPWPWWLLTAAGGGLVFGWLADR